MLELIDREVTQLLLDTAIKQFGENWLQDKLTKNGLLIAKQIILKQPTIEAEPVRHGRWIFVGEETMHDGWTYRKYRCTECNFVTVEAKNFCPNCGADMREEGADNG